MVENKFCFSVSYISSQGPCHHLLRPCTSTSVYMAFCIGIYTMNFTFPSLIPTYITNVWSILDPGQEDLIFPLNPYHSCCFPLNWGSFPKVLLVTPYALWCQQSIGTWPSSLRWNLWLLNLHTSLALLCIAQIDHLISPAGMSKGTTNLVLCFYKYLFYVFVSNLKIIWIQECKQNMTVKKDGE